MIVTVFQTEIILLSIMNRLSIFALPIFYGLMCDLYVMMEFIDVVFIQLL